MSSLLRRLLIRQTNFWEYCRYVTSEGSYYITSANEAYLVKAVVEPTPTPPNNEIWYTSSDGEIVTPHATDVFGANIVSNTYSDGKGIIKFDGDVELIGLGAFYECRSLTSITIPNSVTSIGNNVFNSCSSLISINIPNSVTSIGNYILANCIGLTSVTISNSLTSISDGAFAGCSSLGSVTIPNSVTSIGQFAFSACSSLTSITIPSSVTSIGGNTFVSCSSLTSIYCNSVNEPCSAQGGTFYTNGGASAVGILHVAQGGSAETYPTWMNNQGNLGHSNCGTWTVVDDL